MTSYSPILASVRNPDSIYYCRFSVRIKNVDICPGFCFCLSISNLLFSFVCWASSSYTVLLCLASFRIFNSRGQYRILFVNLQKKKSVLALVSGAVRRDKII